jgi:hypothetical protein
MPEAAQRKDGQRGKNGAGEGVPGRTMQKAHLQGERPARGKAGGSSGGT